MDVDRPTGPIPCSDPLDRVRQTHLSVVPAHTEPRRLSLVALEEPRKTRAEDHPAVLLGFFQDRSARESFPRYGKFRSLPQCNCQRPPAAPVSTPPPAVMENFSRFSQQCIRSSVRTRRDARFETSRLPLTSSETEGQCLRSPCC